MPEAAEILAKSTAAAEHPSIRSHAIHALALLNFGPKKVSALHAAYSAAGDVKRTIALLEPLGTLWLAALRVYWYSGIGGNRGAVYLIPTGSRGTVYLIPIVLSSFPGIAKSEESRHPQLYRQL